MLAVNALAKLHRCAGWFEPILDTHENSTNISQNGSLFVGDIFNGEQTSEQHLQIFHFLHWHTKHRDSFTHAFKVFATLREGSGETAHICIRLASAFAECP